MDICPKCGLPLQACVCEDIAKQEQKVVVSTEKKRYGKIVTIIEGLTNDVNIKEIAKMLKSKLACGGTVKGSKIELQGDHKKKVKPWLIEAGFTDEQIQD